MVIGRLINGVIGLNSPAWSESEGGASAKIDPGDAGEDGVVGESCCSAQRWQRLPITISGGDFNVCGGA